MIWYHIFHGNPFYTIVILLALFCFASIQWTFGWKSSKNKWYRTIFFIRTLSTLTLFCWLWFVVTPSIQWTFGWKSSKNKWFRTIYFMGTLSTLMLFCWLWFVVPPFIQWTFGWKPSKNKWYRTIFFAATAFHGNPFYTNVILLALVCCASIHPVNIWLKIKQKQVISYHIFHSQSISWEPFLH